MSLNCVYCGQINANDAAVCVACGRTLPPTVGARPDPSPPAWGPPDPGPGWQQPPEPPSFGSPYRPDPPQRDAGWGSPPDQYPPYGGGPAWPPSESPAPPFAPPAAPWAPPQPPPQPPNAWSNQWQPPNPYGQPGAQGVWGPTAPPFGAPPFDVADARSKAKSAMVCGIIGIICFGVILGPIALGLGIKAKSTLQRYGVSDGQGMAMAGIVLGTIDIIFALLYFLSLLAR